MKNKEKTPSSLVRKSERSWPLKVDTQIRAGQEEYPPDRPS